jgi:hypothetical protein
LWWPLRNQFFRSRYPSRKLHRLNASRVVNER